MGEWRYRSTRLKLGARWEWQTSRSSRFPLGIYLMWDWVGPTADLDAVARKKFLPL